MWQSEHIQPGVRAALIVLMFSSSLTLSPAQPSGGPYGPIRQKYEIPKGAGTIIYVATNGQSESDGATLANPTTLEAAIQRVRTGDAIILRGGVYRTGNLVLNQGATIQPYQDEQPVLKGTYVADEWENLGNGLWTTKWSRLFPSKPANWWRRHREGKTTPLHRFNNDMVFVDGQFLQSAGWEGDVDENSYYIDYEAGVIYIGVNPKDRLIEITAFDIALMRTTKDVHNKTSDRKGYVIRGVTFTQYAYRALEVEGTEPEGLSSESQHGKDVIGATLEHCTISYCSRVAGYFRGDRFTMRHCRVSDTSTEGVYVIASNDVLLEKNIFMRNNIESITGYYPAAVKIFNQSYRVTCRDNLVTELPNSNGIWYDVGNVDGVFVNNWIENVGTVGATFSTDQLWPSDNGFFFEISKGVVCAGNVFVNCDHGVMILNASNAQIYNNTFVNSMACIGRNARSAQGDHFGWHPSTGPDVDERDGHVFANNLLTGDSDFQRSLLFVWQTPSLCKQLSASQLKEMDCNVYVRSREKAAYPLILWSPAQNDKCQEGFDSLQALRKAYPEFSAHSRYHTGYDGPMFRGSQLKRYDILPSFPGPVGRSVIPPEVRKILDWSKVRTDFVGAYPPRH